jgi:hypothetical protein
MSGVRHAALLTTALAVPRPLLARALWRQSSRVVASGRRARSGRRTNAWTCGLQTLALAERSDSPAPRRRDVWTSSIEPRPRVAATSDVPVPGPYSSTTVGPADSPRLCATRRGVSNVPFSLSLLRLLGARQRHTGRGDLTAEVGLHNDLRPTAMLDELLAGPVQPHVDGLRPVRGDREAGRAVDRRPLPLLQRARRCR